MKKGKKAKAATSEMREEYDFSEARPNKHARRYSEGASLVVIDPALERVPAKSSGHRSALHRWADEPHDLI